MVDALPKALENASCEEAREVWNQIKDSKPKQEKLKKELTQEENLNVRLLLNSGFVKGARVKYVGTAFAEQLAGLELVVHDMDSHHGIACKKPDGSYTTYCNKADLRKL